jgi:hypothetical protein
MPCNRAARAVAHDLGLRRLGLPPGEICSERDEALQLIIERADPLQIRLSQLHRRQFAPGNAARGLRHGYEVQLRCGHVMPRSEQT